MKRRNDLPKSPFSTGLSGSAKEVELRIKTILKGKGKRPAIALMAVVALGIALSGVVVACYPSASSDALAAETLQAAYETDYGARVYWGSEEPEELQTGDIRLDAMELLGETDLGDSTGALYTVTKSIYGQQNGEVRWVTMEPAMEVLVWPDSGESAQLLTPNFNTQGLTPEQIICQTAWGLTAWEVSLWREGHDQPLGIGTEVSHIMEPADGQEDIQVFGEEYAAPIYQEGDCYELHCWPDLTVNCYHTKEADRCHANHITCENPDLVTPRGIHVGSAREEVQEAYPEANNEPFWDWEGDYLCYRPGGGDFGPAVLFLFQVRGEVYDTVQAIFLVNMVD